MATIRPHEADGLKAISHGHGDSVDYTSIGRGFLAVKEICPTLLCLYHYVEEATIPRWADGCALSEEGWFRLRDSIDCFYRTFDSEDIAEENSPAKRISRAVYSEREFHGDKSSHGTVYVIKSDTGHCKIGKARRFHRRMQMFEVKLPFRFEVIVTIKTPDMHILERILHERFSKKRVNGEWFLLDDTDISELRALAGVA